MHLDLSQIAYYNFQPRPDQPHRHDQQTEFLKSKHPGVTFLLGGNGAGTSTLALRKVVEFVTRTPPPRKDTPFWIIANGYEQTMNVCWKEKLHGLGHLPPQEVEWERIRWYKPNNDWPFSVPLKEWPGMPGKNWQLVFKSYAQGRAQMQGESIGGFLFVEQFPWALLEEVLRGCREYSYEGNKLAEFTPVDPAMSGRLQDMEENNDLPPGWAIYRANTECAVEAGHVSQQWFDQYFGMIPKEMLPVRTRGLWGGFEGAIYPEFDAAIHCLPNDWDIPPACHHRRMIDWGFGVDNAFVCLWGCRNGIGQWFIYDEYYSTDTRRSVVEHMKQIIDRHPWPKANSYYGMTWADPSNINCFRIAARLEDYTNNEYQGIGIQAANNSVWEGIEHIKWLLRPDPNLAMPYLDSDGEMIQGQPQPRLFILRSQCPNLVSQMRSYRKVKSNKTGINPRDSQDAVLKSDDHTCFPAGSLVDTPSGQRPIESIMAGDVVYSHLGVSKVAVGSQNTGTRPVIRITLTDGRSIECTAEHPLAIDGNEWCEAWKSLGRDLNVRAECEQKQHIEGTRFRSCRTAGTNGEDTRRTRVIPLATTSGEASERGVVHCVTSGFTNRCTSTSMGRFRKGMTYTTRTRTQAIISQATWRHLLQGSIRNSTRNTSQQQLQRPRSGIDLQKGLNGTERMGKNHGPGESPENCSVNSAGSTLVLAMPRSRRGSAQENVDTMQGSNLESTISMSSASYAQDRSRQIAIDRRKRARKYVGLVRAVRLEKVGGKEVFNLATDDGTYFVNGILVSNCDALRYGLFSEANESGVTPSTVARQHSPSRFGVQIESDKFKKKQKRG